MTENKSVVSGCKFFDQTGRLVVSDESLRSKVSTLKSVYMGNSTSEYNCRFGKFSSALNIINSSFEFINYSFGDFKASSIKLYNDINSNNQLSNINRGFCVPLIVPEIKEDERSLVFDLLLKLIAKINKLDTIVRSKKQVFLGRKYTPIVLGWKLKKPSVAMYYPHSLKDLNIEKIQSEISSLPKNVTTATIESLIAIIMYPEVFLTNENNVIKTYLNSLSAGGYIKALNLNSGLVVYSPE